MVVMIVRCKNCGESSIPYGSYSYKLEPEKLGIPKHCQLCNSVTYKENKLFDWWFCSKKCMLEYLNKTEEEDYKYEWELPLDIKRKITRKIKTKVEKKSKLSKTKRV